MARGTPELMQHEPYTHWTTPQKAVMIVEEKERQAGSIVSPSGKRRSQRRHWDNKQVPHASLVRIASSKDPRRLNNSAIRKETRGRKKILSDRDLRYVEILLWDNGQEARSLSWQHLALEANLNCCGETLRRAMAHKDYRRCKACRRSWVDDKIAGRRVTWATDGLAERPRPGDWHNVRFSDEVHLGYGPEGRIYVTRRPGEKYCPDCVQQVDLPKPEDEKKVHAWGVIGYNYKSELYFYDANNSNGKMTQKVYISLLEKEVTKWAPGFILEEDNDSGHGPSKSNQVRTWKSQHNLQYYFNCPNSPDLAPIENAWKAPKASLRKYAHWDDDTVKEVATEGWRDLSMQTINKWVEEMPKRLQAVIDSNGQMTAY